MAKGPLDPICGGRHIKVSSNRGNIRLMTITIWHTTYCAYLKQT